MTKQYASGHTIRGIKNVGTNIALLSPGINMYYMKAVSLLIQKLRSRLNFSTRRSIQDIEVKKMNRKKGLVTRNRYVYY